MNVTTAVEHAATFANTLHSLSLPNTASSSASPSGDTFSGDSLTFYSARQASNTNYLPLASHQSGGHLSGKAAIAAALIGGLGAIALLLRSRLQQAKKSRAVASQKPMVTRPNSSTKRRSTETDSPTTESVQLRTNNTEYATVHNEASEEKAESSTTTAPLLRSNSSIKEAAAFFVGDNYRHLADSVDSLTNTLPTLNTSHSHSEIVGPSESPNLASPHGTSEVAANENEHLTEWTLISNEPLFR